MIHGVRWATAWFVVAIVLVSRIGIQLGQIPAKIYGGALAAATWGYLAYTLKAQWFGAMFLLAIVWWCAHRLTLDCTLVRDDQEGSDEGILPGWWNAAKKEWLPPRRPLPPALELLAGDLTRRRARKTPRRPGRWVVYFSLAALPLFGIGQVFLPADHPEERHWGFVFLVIYLAAAFSLLATTSFLGLRQYLRRQAVELPTTVTSAWIRFGGLVAGGVLLLALLLPRPGALTFWKSLTYRVHHREHQASQYALPFNSPGKGEGMRTEQPSRNTGTPTPLPPRSSQGNARNDNRVTHDTPQNTAPSGSEGANGSGGSGGSGGGGGSGNSGSGGAGGIGHSDEGQARPQMTLKDTVPPGNADEAEPKKDQPGSDDINPPDRDGHGQKPASQLQRNSPGKTTPRKDAQPPPQARPLQPKETPPPPPPKEGSGPKEPTDWRQLLRPLLILVLTIGLIGLLVRYRKPIAKKLRAAWAAVRRFLQKLFRWRKRPAQTAPEPAAPVPTPEMLCGLENPFATGKDQVWSRERLLRHTYETLQVWAREQRIEFQPQQTPREFCLQLIERLPDVGPELEQFAVYYSHVAFAKKLPDDFENESVRRLWDYLCRPAAPTP